MLKIRDMYLPQMCAEFDNEPERRVAMANM